MRKPWITLKWTPHCWYAMVDGDLGEIPNNVLIPIWVSADQSFPVVKAALLKRFPDAIVSGSLTLQNKDDIPIHNERLT